MAKRITMLDFLRVVGVASDEIPVTVKHGEEVVCTAKSLYWLVSHGTPYELEAKVREAVICKDGILLHIQPKDYNSKL